MVTPAFCGFLSEWVYLAAQKGMRRFVITDIHGCLRSFQALLDQLAFSTADELYLLGDYIDRGPDSKGVIDLILDMQENSYRLHCLRGNHEAMFLSLMIQPASLMLEHYPGLQSTLKSYGCDHPREIPDTHRDFMEGLGYYFELDEYIMVHAGLNFRGGEPLTDLSAMLWERYWYTDIDRQWLGDRTILHGHTPTPVRVIRRQLEQLDDLPALVLDSGCVYDIAGMHQLCAFDLDARQLYFQANVE